MAGLLLWLVSALCVVAGQRAEAQLSLTQLNDTVFHADGTPAAGTVLISWPAFTTAAGQAVPKGSTPVTLGTGGSLVVSLAANAGATPAGTYYTVVYHLDDGTVSREYWTIPAGTLPVKLTAVRTSVLPLSVAMQTVSQQYVDQAIARAALTGGLPAFTGDMTTLAGSAVTTVSTSTNLRGGALGSVPYQTAAGVTGFVASPVATGTYFLGWMTAGSALSPAAVNLATALASPAAIGSTAPNAGSFTTLTGGAGSANYGQLAGGAAGVSPSLSAVGSDSSIDYRLSPKGNGRLLVMPAGTAGFLKASAGSAAGSATLDNGTNDSPNVTMYYGNNVNFSTDTANIGQLSGCTGQIYRLIKNADESGGAVLMCVDTAGGVGVLGSLTAPRVSASSAIGFHEALYTPASSSASCSAGDFWDDANFHYVCTAANTIKRVALGAF